MPTGTHLILATYSGDGNYDAQSTTLTEVVVAPPAPPAPAPQPVQPVDFTLGIGSPLTLGTQRSGTSTVTVTPVNGLADTVALSCGALPLYTTCKIVPSTAAISGSIAQRATAQIAVDQSPEFALLRTQTTLLLAAALFLPALRTVTTSYTEATCHLRPPGACRRGLRVQPITVVYASWNLQHRHSRSRRNLPSGPLGHPDVDRAVTALPITE